MALKLTDIFNNLLFKQNKKIVWFLIIYNTDSRLLTIFFYFHYESVIKKNYLKKFCTGNFLMKFKSAVTSPFKKIFLTPNLLKKNCIFNCF